MTEIITTCFTDIKDSTKLTDSLGHENMMPILKEHLRVGKALIEQNGGKYIKNIGDAHMATFTNPESACHFATEFQQYHEKHHCIEMQPLHVKVSLFLGPVESTDNDAFGSGVNQAARVEHLTEPSQVLVNKDLKQALAKAWGDVKTNNYLKSIGSKPLKGIPEGQELFEFNWQMFVKEVKTVGLARHAFNCLEKAGTIPTNISHEDLREPWLIIWPVVPREIVTAIHRGQIEIARLLALLGWRIHLLVADCGAIVNPTPEQAKKFAKDILEYAKYRGLHNINHDLLSDFFDSSNPKQKDVLKYFKEISSGLKVQELININQKNYEEEVKAEIKSNPILDFLRPILTSAAVLHLADTSKSKKVIVIAGYDEEIQWRHVIENNPHNLAVIYNPLLEELDKNSGVPHTARQRGKWPIWYSKLELKNATTKTNALKWICQLFAKLPSFPSTKVIIDEDVLCDKCSFEKNTGSCEQIDKLIDHVWPILNPASHKTKVDELD